MSYLVLARKWRPETLNEVAGQTLAVNILKRALDADRLHHAILLTGTRGVGKTTLARIIAKALNCQEGVSATPCLKCDACKAIADGAFMDLYEIDAASRTGVDDTRALLENVEYKPAVGRYKVYLIDEVHMFSNASFNALLKTLEEPPPHVKFLLATTDAHKIPATILSRCLQLRLLRIDVDDIYTNLARILTAENIPFEPNALTRIAHAADGSMRDALSLLDPLIVPGQPLDEAAINQHLGNAAYQEATGMLQALADGDGQALMATTRACLAASEPMALYAWVLDALHTITLYCQLGEAAMPKNGPAHEALAAMANQFHAEEAHLLYQLFLDGEASLKHASNATSRFEMLMLRLLAFRMPNGAYDTQGAANAPINAPTNASPQTPMRGASHTAAKTTASAQPLVAPADAKPMASATPAPEPKPQSEPKREPEPPPPSPMPQEHRAPAAVSAQPPPSPQQAATKTAAHQALEQDARMAGLIDTLGLKPTS